MADRRSSGESASSRGRSAASETGSDSHQIVLSEVEVEVEQDVEEIPRTSGMGKGLMVKGHRGVVLKGPYAPGAILSSDSDSEATKSREQRGLVTLRKSLKLKKTGMSIRRASRTRRRVTLPSLRLRFGKSRIVKFGRVIPKM